MRYSLRESNTIHRFYLQTSPQHIWSHTTPFSWDNTFFCLTPSFQRSPVVYLFVDFQWDVNVFFGTSNISLRNSPLPRKVRHRKAFFRSSSKLNILFEKKQKVVLACLQRTSGEISWELCCYTISYISIRSGKT